MYVGKNSSEPHVSEGSTMPLRDHFHPPLDDRASWEEFHGQWPAMIVIDLARRLPPGYVAAPRVHSAQDEYEVRVYDVRRGRRLVAAIEIVSPANKDRPEHRRGFVAKCAALLQQRVSVALVDLVTTRNFNLYGDLLEWMGQHDPCLEPAPPALYAAVCRATRKSRRWLVETWFHNLTIGQPLPTLPLWLSDDLAIPLELEPSYEETCQVLRLT
jgi:hypothetical protein